MTDELGLTADDLVVLDNLGWHALSTVHASLAVAAGPARRYPADVSVFAALERDEADGWDALGTVVDEDETVVVMKAEPVQAGRGWTRLGGGFGNQMVLPPNADLRPSTTMGDVEVVPLSHDHVGRMLDLIAVAQPGPFRHRTIDLGSYYGVLDERGALVAMAGERFRTERFVEVSAVSTHPHVRGRGLGALVTRRVVEGIRERGQIPVLHVAHGNDNAQRLYERLGFVVRRAVSFTALRPEATSN